MQHVHMMFAKGFETKLLFFKVADKPKKTMDGETTRFTEKLKFLQNSTNFKHVVVLFSSMGVGKGNMARKRKVQYFVFCV